MNSDAPFTRPAIQGPRLITDRDSGIGDGRGRCYAIPFDTVWTAASELLDRGVAGFSLLHGDDIQGIFEAAGGRLFGGQPDGVRIRVSLDENVQTRVDLAFDADSGLLLAPIRHRWRLWRFLRALDHKLKHHPALRR